MRVAPTLPRRAAAALSTTLVVGLLPFVAVVPAALPAIAVDSAADATPERVILTPPEHPDTSQSFTWRTGADVATGEVHLREVGAPTWTTHAAYANEVLSPADGVPTRTHSVTVGGLRPATAYEYYVGTPGAVSATYTFTTAGAPGDPFTFIYFGDAQNDVAEKWAPVVRQAYETYPDAVGTVNAGDLINRSNNDVEWTEWFGAMDGYSQTTNVIAAPGNHEYSGDAFLRNWRSAFEYDANGPVAVPAADDSPAERQRAAYEAHMAQGMRETVYFTDYQGVRFISLNATINTEMVTPADLPACAEGCPDPGALWLDMQARWLDRILADNPHKWSVVTFHQPVFSTAEGRDEEHIRAAWLPVFQRNDVDLVLMGHDHTYARGYVDADATDTPGVTTGPVYAVSVSGPKYYEQQPVDDNVWTRNGATQVTRAGHTSTFQGITVTDDQLRYESVVAAKWDGESTTDVPVGGVLDSFTITEHDDGTKYVTEDGVAIPGGEEPLPAAPTFADVPADAPFAADVRWLAERRLTAGYPVGDEVLFRPAAPMSRQAMAAFLYRAAGTDWTPGPGTQTFADVGPDHPFHTQVEWMFAEGLATGYGDTFGATTPVSRQATAAFLHRMAGEPAAAPAATFTDVPADHAFGAAIGWAQGAGVVEGYGDDTFAPHRPVTRQAMAAFLHRYDTFVTAAAVPQG